MYKIIAPLLLLLAGLAHGQVYVCDDNGHKTFSQQPCGNNAKEVPLDNPDGSVTVSGKITLEQAHAICRLNVRAIELANQLWHEQIAIGVAQIRVRSFLHEHITNYSEVLQQNPHFGTTIDHLATLFTQAGYSFNNADDEERNSAVTDCTKTVYDDAVHDGDTSPGSQHSGDKML